MPADELRRVSYVAPRDPLPALDIFDRLAESPWTVTALDERLLGRNIHESSAMDSAVTTGSTVLLARNFEQFLIYDGLRMTLVNDPVVLRSNRRPTGQGAWFAYRRVGADVTDANAFRMLTL